MIKLPNNWLKTTRVHELPHDPFRAVLLLSFKNAHDQVFNWYQVIEGEHGVRASAMLEEGLKLLSRIDFANEEPYVNKTQRQKTPALDQEWEQVLIPNTINLKDFRTKHSLKDPEEAHVI
jgi:hypothetical protein